MINLLARSEAIVASLMDKFHLSRNKSTALVTVYGIIVGTIVCFGYNFFYFELQLPNGSVARSGGHALGSHENIDRRDDHHSSKQCHHGIKNFNLVD